MLDLLVDIEHKLVEELVQLWCKLAVDCCRLVGKEISKEN